MAQIPQGYELFCLGTRLATLASVNPLGSDLLITENFFPALALKDIDYEYRAVHLVRDGGEQNKEEYKAINFFGQVTHP